MARTLTNNFSLAYAIESTVAVLPGSPEWRLLEPNTINAFGANISTVARTPISKNRQRSKGTITDLDAAVEFESDLTMNAALDFLEGFAFSTAVNDDTSFEGAAAVATTDDYTVPALVAANAAKIQFTSANITSLLYARGYTNAANNGLKTVLVQPVATDTTLQVAETLVTETAPTNAIVEVCGVRVLATSDLTITRVTGPPDTATIVSAASVDWTTLGLTVGQFVHVGGTAAVNQPDDLVGYGRIITITATTLTLDKLNGTIETGSSPENPAKVIDILFGRFIRNETVDATGFLERTFQFEGTYPNLFETTPATPVAEPDGHEYTLGAHCNQLSFNLPLTDKATLSYGFVGTDAEAPVDGGSRKTNADTPIEPLQVEAINTTSDIARLRVTEADETGLTTDFKSMTITLNNNVSPEKVLGTLGAAFVNTGTFEVSMETQVLFSSAEVIAAIRANTTVTMDFLLANNDGGIYVDIPSMTIGGGNREFPVNETILASLTGEAFADPTFNTSLGLSLFPITP